LEEEITGLKEKLHELNVEKASVVATCETVRFF